MITYRKATKEDIGILVKTRIEFLYEAVEIFRGRSPNELEETLEEYFSESIPTEEFIGWLAFNEGELVATSGLSFYRVPPVFNNLTGRVGYIMNMFTKPEWRRKGIGSKLLEIMMEEAKKKNISKLVLHATDDGKPLYEKFGFKTKHTEMVFRLKNK
jgi:GNAT superfamily N-acetyltransferase